MATLRIVHTHADGTLVEGTSRGGPEIPILKSSGFRWFPSIGKWGLCSSRDHMARRYVIEETAKALRAAGTQCQVEIDDTPRDADERHADEAARLEDRRDALEDKAERLIQKGTAAYQRGASMLDQIPTGQPLLTDHYSYGRDRRYRDRATSNIRKGLDLKIAGNRTAAAVDASERHELYRQSGPVTVRRIERFEAELRQLDRLLAEQLVPADRERFSARRELVIGELAYWRAHLDSLVCSGQYTPTNAALYSKGDVIATVHGEAEVMRVNPTTLSVVYRAAPINGWKAKIRYEEVKGKVTA